MTYKELINSSTDKPKARKIIYFLSSKIKNLNDYALLKNQKIDFCIKEFNKHMHDSNSTERLEKKVFFYGQKFTLMDNVFCPRNETELLVEYLNKEIKRYSTYIDICCGTGVIGISVMLHNPNLQTSFLDISSFAIENTKHNLLEHKLNAKVIQSDWLEHLKNNNYEVISANFPYIGNNDPIDKNILKYDPPLALFAEEEGWFHYRKLLEHIEINKFWKLIVLECNSMHEQKWKKIRQKLKKYSFEFIYDFNNLFRIVVIKK